MCIRDRYGSDDIKIGNNNLSSINYQNSKVYNSVDRLPQYYESPEINKRKDVQKYNGQVPDEQAYRYGSQLPLPAYGKQSNIGSQYMIRANEVDNLSKQKERQIIKSMESLHDNQIKKGLSVINKRKI
eukprot:TRINITY_DN11344_c0_g1_i1.p1 TRINITY_DN11344_c0_g1~~TRINITY_DN11344_c0_g1_i1.p1  ORF type:complete len:128 (-),score=6.37 TRINITY_DN11344_c0_g1_i1:19-402(-)